MIKLIKVNRDGEIVFTDKELEELLKEVYENGRQDGMSSNRPTGIEIKEYTRAPSPNITWTTTTAPYYSNTYCSSSDAIVTSTLNLSGEVELSKETENGTSTIC